MEEKWLAQRFADGVLKSVTAARPLMKSSGWVLVFLDKRNTAIVLERQRGGQREFDTLDAAFNAAKRIGFRSITVEESQLLG